MQSSIEISKLIEDVSYVISSKLKDALNPVIETQNSTEIAILNLPFIQKIVNENRSLKLKNSELETKLALVRENYKRLFLSKVSNQASAKVENNINLEIEEMNINKSDFDSISKIEEEIMELNKDEFDSLEDSDVEPFPSSEPDSEDEDEDEKLKELQFIITSEPEMCQRAIKNYKTFYKMQSIPSIQDVFNSAAGIMGWGNANLNNKKDYENVRKEEQVEKKVEKEEEVEEEEEEEEEVEEVEEAEVEEEEAEEEEAEEEEEEVEEEEEEVDENEDSEEEDELEVEEVMIKGKMYYTDSHLNGDIYRVGDDGDIEDIVGKFEKSQAIFF